MKVKYGTLDYMCDLHEVHRFINDASISVIDFQIIKGKENFYIIIYKENYE